MDPRQIEALCNELGLGDITIAPTALSGGLLHRMYAVQTTSGKYVVKALNEKLWPDQQPCKTSSDPNSLLICQMLNDWNLEAINSAKQMLTNMVISHGDLDPKNVLWNRRGSMKFEEHRGIITTDS
ncbi:hypothetical protein [Paenibacillus sp. MMO-58]|uniref:hypothetical protein n=1 Tax=Paenibacillus sp. MMO-58 TaxID=3081290 RepID=UPI0030193738